jgi:branched-subunit amino acid transport protein
MWKNTSLSTMCAVMSKLFSRNLDVNVCNGIINVFQYMMSKLSSMNNTSLSIFYKDNMWKNTSLSTMCAVMSKLFSKNLDVNVCSGIINVFQYMMSRLFSMKNTSLYILDVFNEP